MRVLVAPARPTCRNSCHVVLLTIWHNVHPHLHFKSACLWSILSMFVTCPSLQTSPRKNSRSPCAVLWWAFVYVHHKAENTIGTAGQTPRKNEVPKAFCLFWTRALRSPLVSSGGVRVIHVSQPTFCGNIYMWYNPPKHISTMPRVGFVAAQNIFVQCLVNVSLVTLELCLQQYFQLAPILYSTVQTTTEQSLIHKS